MDETLTVDYEPALLVAAGLEIALLLAGLIVLWRLYLSANGRIRSRSPRPLGAWLISGQDFLTAVLYVVGGGFILQTVLVLIARTPLFEGLTNDPDLWLILQGGFFQFGMLAGAGSAMATLHIRSPALPDSPPPATGLIRAGFITFLAALPVVTGVNLVWLFLLETFGLPTMHQELVDLFVETESLVTIIVFLLFAVVVAPVTEELIFRAGLFRYLRTRAPRWVALTLPALIFAALHGNLSALGPLLALGVVFAIAYERTGRIAVPMIAHGLFNLNTVLLLLAGAPVSV